MEYFVNGWGGRIRTCASWIQSPLPYRLATPQFYSYHTFQTKKGQLISVDLFSLKYISRQYLE